MTPARVMINTAAALAVVGLAWLLLKIVSVIVILILGIILATAIEPFVFRLRRRGLSRGQSILAIYASLGLILALASYLVLPPLATQASELVEQTPEILADLKEQASESNNDFLNTTGVRTIERAERAYEQARASPPVERSTAVSVLTSVFGGLFTIVSVMIVAFYWMTEKAIIKRLILGLFPIEKRDRAHDVWDEIEAKLGGWTRGQLILMMSIGVASGAAYFALGLDFWLPLAIFAGITEIIPFIGPILGGAAAVTVALTDSWQKAVIVAVFVFLLQQLEGAVLVPRVMRNAVGLTPLTVILAVFIGGAIMGPLGSILAIPIAAAVQVLVQNLLAARADDSDVGMYGASTPVPSVEMAGTAPVRHAEQPQQPGHSSDTSNSSDI